MTVDNLTQIFELFGSGLIIGALFSAMSFIIGYSINFIFNLTK